MVPDETIQRALHNSRLVDELHDFGIIELMHHGRSMEFRSIKQLLNRSLEQIDQSTFADLDAARTRALNCHEACATATLPLFAWPGVHVIQHVSTRLHKICNWTGILLLAACISNGIVYYWQETMDNNASNDDIEILTGDLPIEYFLE